MSRPSQHALSICVTHLVVSALLLFSTGCQNVCQRARDHVVGCLEEVCADVPGLSWCAQDRRAQVAAQLSDTRMRECGPEIHREAQRAMQLTCINLVNGDALWGTGQ